VKPVGKRPFHANLEALRGIAALLVVLHHLSLTAGSVLSGVAPLRQGWLFVDLFFVLSGFVIASVHAESGQSVRRILERIAKEGRKYGVSLGLITQRPSDLAEGVLSQCGTIISMRLNNDRDQACVRAAMPEGARGFLDAIPALRNRECIACGEGVAIPIRVRFDDLEPEKRPASADPSFARLWRETGDEAGIIQRTIKRWRGHGR
jgi:hypothetical protein